MVVSLIGYRGSGKTTVARLLAQRLGWDWVDADVEIQRHEQRTIADIFAADGEETFRDLESRMLSELLSRDRYVLALGGGVILRPANRDCFADCAAVIWLRAGAATLQDRISGDATTAARRPDLTDLGGLQEISTLLEERAPLYQQCADFVVDTEGRTPHQVVDEIVSRLPPDVVQRPRS